MAAKVNITANQRRSIVSRYTKRDQGLVQIAEETGLGIGVVRRVLTEEDVQLRGRGRPRRDS